MSTTLGITCDASALGTYTGMVSIVNNDSSENPYEFAIRCIVNPAGSDADLSLSKIVSDITPQFDDVITYTVTVNNVGPGATTGVQVVDILPTSVTFEGFVDLPSQGTAVLGVDNFTNINSGLPAIIWDVGTMTNPQTATLSYQVRVQPTVGTTSNYAQVTASSAPDSNSTPNDGVYLDPIDDDEAMITFLFDPPFGRKAFTEAGQNVLEWTIIWVNPSNNPIPVVMSDPLLGGTTFVPGSLVCTPFGASTQTQCEYDSITNTILFAGIIAPNPGATVGDTLTASNRLEIVYRVFVPDGVTTVTNTATLTNLDNDTASVVTETYTRTITPPPTGGMTAEEIQVAVKNTARHRRNTSLGRGGTRDTAGYHGGHSAWDRVVLAG